MWNTAQQHGQGGTQNSLSSKQIAAQKLSMGYLSPNWEEKQKLHYNQPENLFLHNNNQHHILPPTRNAAQQYGQGDHAKFSFI